VEVNAVAEVAAHLFGDAFWHAIDGKAFESRLTSIIASVNGRT
jgi:hypothetical protein